jgi:hypothetical protein
MPLYPPSAAASLELTDGTHDVDPVAKITVTGATVGGTTPDATLTVSGGASGGTPALTLGTSNAAGSSGTFIRDDDQIAVFDATTPAGVAESASHGSTGYAADAGHAHPGLGAALGLTGATGATRYVGATTSGHPTSGTFAVGDYVVAQDGHVWVCTGAGTSGTWVDTGAGGGIADEGAFTYLDATDAAAPGNPSAGYHRIYSKTGGLYYRDSSGTEVGPLAAAGSYAGAPPLEQHDASNSATLDFTSFISSTYDTYLIEGIGLVAATGGENMRIQFGYSTGPTWDTGASYEWAGSGYGSDGSACHWAGGGSIGGVLFDSMSTAGGYGFGTFSVTLSNPQSTALWKTIQGTLHYANSAPQGRNAMWGMQWNNASTPATGLRFIMGSGNIVSGTIRIYGIAKS